MSSGACSLDSENLMRSSSFLLREFCGILIVLEDVFVIPVSILPKTNSCLSRRRFFDSVMHLNWYKASSPLLVTLISIFISSAALSFPLDGTSLRFVATDGGEVVLPVDQSISRVFKASDIFVSSLFLKSSNIGFN